jgi:adrenodoxin-NADP+ reductase
MAPLKLAIIGGGPSSFYVASRLLSLFPKDEPLSSQLKIHIYDRLWVPHGLVRYGVTPDHPEVKARFPLTPASSLSKPFFFFLESIIVRLGVQNPM